MQFFFSLLSLGQKFHKFQQRIIAMCMVEVALVRNQQVARRIKFTFALTDFSPPPFGMRESWKFSLTSQKESLAGDCARSSVTVQTRLIAFDLHYAKPYVTWSTTSTSYEFPLDFWNPRKTDPLYKSDLLTPICFEFSRNGTSFSRGTGITWISDHCSRRMSSGNYFAQIWKLRS